MARVAADLFDALTRPGSATVWLIGGFPLWWALGLGEVIWIAFGPIMALSMLVGGKVTVPRFASLWVLFLVAVAASGLTLAEQRDVFTWGIRFGQYLGAGMIVPYVLTHRHTTPPRAVFAAVSALFVASVVGGYVGLVVGDLSFRSPFAYVLPGSIRANSFVHEVVNPGFADIERFLGRFSVTRPKAPFTYTNGWGAAMGLLSPFAICDALFGYGLSRRLMRVAVVAAAVPIALSLNQGLWVSLIAAGGYAALRSAGRGDTRIVLQLLAIAFLVAVAIVVTPLGSAFRSELQNPNATQDRFELYQATLAELPESPLVGFGGPKQVTDGGPPAGTHGQFWIVLFSHGTIGAITYFGFIGAMLWSVRRYLSPVGLWCHTVVFVSFVQAPFYGHVPQQLAIIMVAAAIGILDASGFDMGSIGQSTARSSRSTRSTINNTMA